MSNLNIDPQVWLNKLFESEYCNECGGDAQHHTAIPLNGNWFARCNYSPGEETNWEYHPVIIAFRKKENNPLTTKV